MNVQHNVQRANAIVGSWDQETCFALAALAREGEVYVSIGEEVIDLTDPDALFDMAVEEGDVLEFIYDPTLTNSELLKQLVKVLEHPRLAG